jgi:hypothetical protein
VWRLALFYKDTLTSLDPSGDAKRIAALKDIIKSYETSIRALREALGMNSMTIY